jgi:hypothetical protein
MQQKTNTRYGCANFLQVLYAQHSPDRVPPACGGELKGGGGGTRVDVPLSKIPTNFLHTYSPLTTHYSLQNDTRFAEFTAIVSKRYINECIVLIHLRLSMYS